MCVTSAILDYGGQTAPWRPQPPQKVWPAQPNIIPGPNITPPIVAPPELPPTPEQIEKWRKWIEAFDKLMEAGEEFDAAAEQPDCEDPEKAKLLEEIDAMRARLDELEEEVEKR